MDQRAEERTVPAEMVTCEAGNLADEVLAVSLGSCPRPDYGPTLPGLLHGAEGIEPGCPFGDFAEEYFHRFVKRGVGP